MSRRRALPLALLTTAALALTGCGDDAGAGTADGVQVVAGFYPLQFVAERVGGDAVEVENVTSPGAEAHDVELTPRQVAEVSEADLLLYLDGFQPALDEAAEQAPEAFDISSVVSLENPGEHDHATEDDHGHEDEHDHAHDLTGDPHFWLDPSRLALVAEQVADRLAELDAANADAYRTRAEQLADDLGALDAEIAAGLETCERRMFVTSHAAFGYLADRYHLEMVPISGLSPDAEPSPARVREVQEVVEREGVDTIFYERLVSPKVAETMAADLGVSAAVLDPIEGLTDETKVEDYFSLMRQNLQALRTANGCS